MAGSGDLSEAGKKAMRLTLSQIAGFGGSGRWRMVRRREWRGLVDCDAVVSGHELRRRGAAMAAQFSLCRSRMREGEELGQLWCGVATL
jgi:hypothetical protein